jgi:hypothetical protein
MSPLEREEAVIKLRADLFPTHKIIQRLLQISWKGFPMSHISSFMIQHPQGRAFKEYARERKKKNEILSAKQVAHENI